MPAVTEETTTLPETDIPRTTTALISELTTARRVSVIPVSGNWKFYSGNIDALFRQHLVN